MWQLGANTELMMWQVIVESEIVSEFLDETCLNSSRPPLVPADPRRRAAMRTAMKRLMMACVRLMMACSVLHYTIWGHVVYCIIPYEASDDEVDDGVGLLMMA